MRRQICKRVEVLERAADKEVFANAFQYAIAYYGGAKHPSEAPHAFARALGYQNLEASCHGLAELLCQPPGSVDPPSGIRARAGQAQRELLAKFGYDVRRLSPAALADAIYLIVRSLPEEWCAMIKTAHREWCESEAAVNEILSDLTEFAEEQ
jgi:hypothetical protein